MCNISNSQIKHVQYDNETCATSQIPNETCATSWVKPRFPCYLAQISSSRQIWNPMFQWCNMDISLVHFSMLVEQSETQNDCSWKSVEYQSWTTHQDLQLLYWSFLHPTKW
jgi:hypothetical protein